MGARKYGKVTGRPEDSSTPCKCAGMQTSSSSFTVQGQILNSTAGTCKYRQGGSSKGMQRACITKFNGSTKVWQEGSKQSRAKQSPPTRLIQGLHITYRPLPKALRGHTAGSTLSSLISIISTTSWRSRSSSGQVKASLKVSCRSLLGSSKTLPCEA